MIIPARLRLVLCQLSSGTPSPLAPIEEYSNRPIDVESLVPPENVYHEIHGHIGKSDNFEMGDWKVFDDPCNTLRCKPPSSE